MKSDGDRSSRSTLKTVVFLVGILTTGSIAATPFEALATSSADHGSSALATVSASVSSHVSKAEAAGLAGDVRSPAPKVAGASGRSVRGRLAVARSQRIQKQARADRAAWAWAQMAILAAALVLVVVVGARNRPRLRPLVRRLLLGLLAAAAAVSYVGDDVFDSSPRALHLKDVYHYWVGTRYFEELGYDGLYECTLAVAAERDWWWASDLSNVRDLRTNEPRPAVELIARGLAECPARFSPDRWQAFSDDVAWFDDVLGFQRWRRILNDHGYNPSPVWASLAKPFASLGGPESLIWLARIDLALLAAAFIGVGWAFGFEAACLAIIVWGTGWLWDARWIGHAFLRQIWFSSAILGVCFIKQGAGVVGGSLVALSSSVRIFPALMAVGVATGWIRRASSGDDGAVLRIRFAIGFALGLCVWLGASFVFVEQGLEAWSAFTRNLSTLRSVTAVNAVGLEPLLWRFDGTSALWQQGAHAIPEIRAPLHRVSLVVRGLVTLGMLALAWRGVRNAEPWEAAAGALFLLPVLTAPSGYYMQFVVLGVMLGARRPAVTCSVLLACFGWILGGVFAPSPNIEFGIASALAMVLVCIVFFSLARPVSRATAEAPDQGLTRAAT